MATIIKDLGAVTAYAYAVEQGYTGTEEEFAELMASYADVAEDAAESAAAAEQAKEDALTAKTAAEAAAATATTKASAAATSADAASSSASTATTAATTATTKAGEATTAATTATTKATEAAASAETATTAASEAADSADAAAVSEEQAEEAADYIVTHAEKLDGIEEEIYKVYPTETVTGDIVNISDGAEDIPVKALSVAVEPVQTGSGDPSPDNVRTITGWNAVSVVRCGKNLLDWDAFYATMTHQRCTAQKLADGRVEVTSTATGAMWVGSATAVGNSLPSGAFVVSAKKGQAFVLSGAVSYNYYEIDSDRKVLASASNATGLYTIQNDACRYFTVRYVFGDATATGVTSIHTPQMEIGSTATAYEPYSGATYPITLPSTVYGGTLDVSTGVMTVDRAYITADGTTIKATGGYGANGAERLPAISLTGASKGATAMTGVIASYLKTATSSSILQSTSNTIGIGSGGALIVLHINDIIGNNGAHGYNSDTELFAACNAYLASNPLQIAYKLATPYTITLDPTTISTLLGNNTIYADAGQVTVAYRADVGLYIDKRIAEVQALVLES